MCNPEFSDMFGLLEQQQKGGASGTRPTHCDDGRSDWREGRKGTCRAPSRRRKTVAAFALPVVLFATFSFTANAYAQTQSIRVDLKLLTGGGLSGLVVDYSEDALVVAHGQTPYVFAWNELDAGSAYRVKRDLVTSSWRRR